MSEFVPQVVESSAAPAPRPGPGGRLQAARLERNLDVAAVALALRVAPKLVEALEADQFDAFDAPVYTRGYLRSYARFLGLSADEVLAAYDAVAGSPPPQTLLPPASARPLPRDLSGLKKGGWLVLALALVGVSYWWWMGRVAPPAPVAPAIVAASSAPAGSEPAAVTDGDSPNDVALPPPESVTLGGTPDTPPGTVPSVAVQAAPAPTSQPAAAAARSQPVAEAPSSTPRSLPAASAPAVAPAPVAMRNAAAPASAPGAAPPAAAPAASAKAGTLAGQPPPPLVAPVADGPTIVLRGKTDCWVEVRAAGGARLFYGLVRPGETHTMPGPAPWFVFLGYADGIEVSVGGHVVEVPASRREGAKARFGLTADGTLR